MFSSAPRASLPRRFPAPISAAAVAAAAALLATVALAPAVLAAPDKPSVEYVLTENHGNPEGVAWDPETQTFFTGTVADGTIYRGTLGDTSVDVWVAGPGTPAVGMKVWDGRLYVAGGPSGSSGSTTSRPRRSSRPSTRALAPTASSTTSSSTSTACS